MYRNFMQGLIVFCVFSLLALCVPVNAEICNRVVAIVNDDVITLYELNSKIKQLTGADPQELRNQNESAFLDTRRKILDFLIDDKIAQKKIDELGIKVSKADVDAAIEKVKRDNNLTQEDLLAQLKRQGVSYEAYRENVRNEIERMQLINFEVKSKIIVREESIQTYYEKHLDQFTTHETLHLAAIILPPENPADHQGVQQIRRLAEELYNRLKAGEDFGALARTYSKGPGAQEGGDLGFFKTDQLNQNLLDVVEGMRPGEFSQPLATASGFQIIKLIERRPGGTKPFEEVKDAIYSELYREEINKRYTEWLKQLRDQAYTKIIF